MKNFEFYCPTRIVFGKGAIAKLGELIDQNKKVLILSGCGSVKKNGVYAQVLTALEGYRVVEFSGIEPNPKYETCMGAVRLAREEKVDFLLAVGGGSVLDGTKFIAAAAMYDGSEPYDIVAKGLPVKEALPLGDVMTLPATGSEMNANAVISRLATNEKLPFASEKVYPQFSILDPQVTFSLPLQQTINGMVDTFAHVMELYATCEVNTPLQDSWALGLIRTLIQEAPKVNENPTDYDARANIFWCATCGLNYWLSLGVVQDWSTHMIGHELTALYGIDHGQSLAIVLPRLWENQRENKEGKLAKLAREVFGVCGIEDELASVVAIRKTEDFFRSLGMKTKLADYGIDAKEAAEKIKERFAKRGVKFGERGAVTAEVAYTIVQNS